VGDGARRWRRGDNHSPCNPSGATRRKIPKRTPPGDVKTDARRNEENSRHSGLDPESSAYIPAAKPPQKNVLYYLIPFTNRSCREDEPKTVLEARRGEVDKGTGNYLGTE
jgi:hypothetical protein